MPYRGDAIAPARASRRPFSFPDGLGLIGPGRRKGVPRASLRFGLPRVAVLEAHDVVLGEQAAGLHFDHLERC